MAVKLKKQNNVIDEYKEYKEQNDPRMMLNKLKKKYPWKYNEAGYFNLKGYLSYMCEDWELLSWILILNAPRNIGKSYGVWEYIVEIWEKFKGKVKICYCRSNKEKLMRARENFNSHYGPEYYMSESKIYKMFYDEKGKKIDKEKIEMGSVVAINQAENYKSGFFDNHQLFFWDEYNEVSANRGVFEKFLDLLKTIKRKTDPFHILLIGNNVNQTNDILHNLEVDFDEIPNFDDDYFKWIRKDIFFIQIGNNTFKQHNPSSDIVNVLASFNETTDNYLNAGGYIENKANNLILYKKYVEPTKTVLKYFALGEFCYEFGSFYKNDIKQFYFHVVPDIPKGYFGYSLSILGDIRQKNSKILEKEDMTDIAEMLKKYAKAGRLWYCEYDTKMDLELFIRSFCDIN